MKICADKIWTALSSEKQQQFSEFCSLLLSENQKYNLTAIRTEAGIFTKHFKDSISVTPLIEKINKKELVVGDFGSGPGFPGLPVKLLLPELQMHLIESNGKKTFFQKMIIDHFKLKKTHVQRCRMENFTKRNFFDILLCRSVCYLPMLMEIVVPFVKKGGIVYAFKDKAIEQSGELEHAEKAYSYTHMKIEHIHDVTYEGIQRIIVEIHRKGDPSNGIPRTYSKIKRIWKEKCQK